MKRVKIIIEGRVQGVGFRCFTARAALKLDIKGFVKNNYDGTVEVVAQGDNSNIGLFILEIRKGPSSSFVTGFDIISTESKNNFTSFDITY
ncbi:acylphosphatase [bacterium]|nr:acylphosphatase [bacterium]